MVKRASAENARQRKASEDMTDGDKKPPKKKSKYNLRNARKRRTDDTEWIDDDTLITSDEESEEDDNPKYVISIDFDDEEDESDWEPSKKMLSSMFGKKEKESKKKFPIKLTKEEQQYFEKQPLKKRDELMNLMTKVSQLTIENGEIPNKFQILQLPIPDYMKSSVIKKLSILSEMGNDVGESYKLRTWVEAFLRIPFGKTTPLPIQLSDGKKKCSEFMIKSRQIMDKEIYGMVSAKTQILQIMAQWMVNPNSVGNVIALQGAMGVGKTSIARNAIAKVLNRPFEFFSLGGSSDISNFIGHSYTYEGSMWGRIADSLMHAGVMNPVMYFDELDKVSTTPQGEEITSMMIHLTDRSQNSQFHDRYFSGVDFDMSQCLFVFSFNDIEKVHPILRDRMTIINCTGYNEKDKTEILKKHIWPQLIERLRFSTNEVTITDQAISYLISEFSEHEKGVRSLIRAVETMITRLNMFRVSSDEIMKEYAFYLEFEFPINISRQIAETLLTNYDKKEADLWKSMYV